MIGVLYETPRQSLTSVLMLPSLARRSLIGPVNSVPAWPDVSKTEGSGHTILSTGRSGTAGTSSDGTTVWLTPLSTVASGATQAVPMTEYERFEREDGAIEYRTRVSATDWCRTLVLARRDISITSPGLRIGTLTMSGSSGLAPISVIRFTTSEVRFVSEQMEISSTLPSPSSLSLSSTDGQFFHLPPDWRKSRSNGSISVVSRYREKRFFRADGGAPPRAFSDRAKALSLCTSRLLPTSEWSIEDHIRGIHAVTIARHEGRLPQMIAQNSSITDHVIGSTLSPER
ncbi:uncharacterized protein PgNI_02272 [Pyricularia grisea]|uniref:Uncharacterized protein n=1 Tax=Pyricularia grisea TaxID=148305 RepID=A0A6P8BJM6_PYRGI|nr:uncharacterized protein PgNI_02272 [Pyricularia grisea]TLD17101.1 hypothetical protein PgNI_02272 [Pyricularia grisea]